MTNRLSQTQINSWILSAKDWSLDLVLSFLPVMVGISVWLLSGGAQFHGVPIALMSAASVPFVLIFLLGKPFADFLDHIMPLGVGALAFLGLVSFSNVDIAWFQSAVSYFLFCITCVLWMPFAYMKSRVMRARIALNEARKRAEETLERSRQITGSA